MGRAGGANWRCRGGRVRGGTCAGAHSLQSATGAGAMPVPGFAKQGAVLGQQMRRGRTVCSLQLATGAGLMPVPGEGALGNARKMHFFGQICTSRSDFPRSLLFKGANLPKPVHASRLRPTRTPPTPHTHLAHAPHAPRSRPILRCPTVQKTGRFTSPSPISAGHSPPKSKSAGFLYPPHQIAPTGRNAPAI